MKNAKQRTRREAMPLVRVIRNGQITLPKELRDKLGIQEGDFLEVTLTKSGMCIAPKTVVDSELAKGRFFQMVDEIRRSMEDADPQEVEAAITEAIRAAKNAKSRKLKPNND